MYKVKECIIVEGSYDKIKLAGFLDAVIIRTDGFSIFKNKERMRLIRKMAEETGIVILTDSDSAGFQIRNYIKQSIPEKYVKHAYIPDIAGKERRKRVPGREGLLGVEGMSEKVVLEALKRAGCTIDGEESSVRSAKEITKAYLYRLGLSGTSDSSKRREKLLKKLELPSKISANMLLDILNTLMSAEELGDFVQKNID